MLEGVDACNAAVVTTVIGVGELLPFVMTLEPVTMTSATSAADAAL
jgi:hypothetical protein